MITLYGSPRSPAISPLWISEALNVRYDNVKVSFVNKMRTPEFLRLNPNGRASANNTLYLLAWTPW